MKLYTRTGDDGTTGLFGGGRVPKNHPRIEACGYVDELNASIGLAAAAITSPPTGDTSTGNFRSLTAVMLGQLQSRLFDLGADLATPLGGKHEEKVHRISERDVADAEKWIDQIEAGNEPQTHFVLPGGSELAARLHVARTVCRTAERAMVTLAQSEQINVQATIYINRISDLLFAMARRANRDSGVADVIWQSNARPETNT